MHLPDQRINLLVPRCHFLLHLRHLPFGLPKEGFQVTTPLFEFSDPQVHFERIGVRLRLVAGVTEATTGSTSHGLASLSIQLPKSLILEIFSHSRSPPKEAIIVLFLVNVEHSCYVRLANLVLIMVRWFEEFG
ncbi:hypothetical protein TNCT_245011 [Trichonephila clavata]|uniref:Uncharacterized protein n=1 Tax=Trichonephila clavata TaxID=2740835 RepID=A0A8X6FGC9_TRICU|nr:hypothetical protein TNCT_245011 [Trichonephila clavata]